MANRSNSFISVNYEFIRNLSNDILRYQDISKSCSCNCPSSHVLTGNASYKPVFHIWIQDCKLKEQSATSMSGICLYLPFQ